MGYELEVIMMVILAFRPMASYQAQLQELQQELKGKRGNERIHMRQRIQATRYMIKNGTVCKNCGTVTLKEKCPYCNMRLREYIEEQIAEAA